MSTVAPRSSPHRYLELDGLRGMAVLLVVWHNVVLSARDVPKGLASKIFISAAGAGWIGVTFFFVLSGFLITGILRDTREQPGRWPRFLLRRSLRIFPLYYVTLAVLLVGLPALGQLPTWLIEDHEHQVFYWTYLINWTSPFGLGGTGLSHFWSLAVEEQFYLVWPIIAFTVGSRALAATCVGLAAVSLGARALLQQAGLEGANVSDAIYSFTICRWDALVAGALVALAVRSTRFAPVMPRWGTVIAAVGGAVLGSLVLWRHSLNPWDPAVQLAGHSGAAILGAGLVIMAIAPDSSVGKALRLRSLRILGKYSYAIYIFHYLLIRAWVERYLTAQMQGLSSMEAVCLMVAASLAVLVVSLLAAMVSWRFLEYPILALRETRRLSGR